MTTDKADLLIEAKQKGLLDAVKTIKLLRTEAASTQLVFEGYARSFNEISKSIGKSRLEAAQFFRDLNKYAKGSINTQIAAAETGRIVSDLKAQTRDINSIITNTTMGSVNEARKALAAQAKLTNAGITKSITSDNVLQVAQQVDLYEKGLKVKKQEETVQQRLNKLSEQYQRKQIEFNSRGAISKGADSGSVLMRQVELTRAKNLLELNAVQIKKAQIAQDEKTLSILQARQVSLRKIVVQEEQILASARAQAAQVGQVTKLTDAQRRNQKVDFVTGDGGASLFKIQASLLVNYALMNQLFTLFNFGSQFVLQLDKAFADLQATIAATDGQMTGLKKSIIDVSQGTKFTAVEVAKAALILGQAGFSIDQIQSSIQGVTLLATATGSNLETSVDVATSAISVFNLRAEDMGHIANVITGAINETKLTMDKLALGFQYAGNIAAEAGLSFEETTAILGGLANAGIRSGSTLGTGLRQLLTEFINPSEKFSKSLEKINLTIEDVDVKAKGFVGVLNTLKEAGFTASDAFESLDLRAAAAFAAIQNDPEIINRLQQSFIYTTAAAKANEIQMKSLSNTFDQFKGALGSFVNAGSGPVVDTLQIITSAMSQLLIGATNLGPAMTIAGSAMVAFGTAVAGVKLTQLITNLLLTETAVKVLGISIKRAAIETLGVAIVRNLGPIGIITVGLTALIAAFEIFGNIVPSAMDKLDQARTSFQNAQGEVVKTQETITSIDESMARLIQRFGELKNSPESVRTEFLSLQARFGSLGLKIENETNPSIYNLIDALRDLKKELADVSAAQIDAALTEKALLVQREAEVARQKTEKNSTGGFDFGLLPGSFSQPKSRYSDNFVSGSKTASGLASDFAGRVSGSDLPSASAAELKKLENEGIKVLRVLGEYQADTIRALDKLKKNAASGKKINKAALDKYQERLDAQNSDIEQVSGIMAGLLDLQAQQSDKIKATFERTDLYQSYTKRIEEFEKNVGVLRSELAGEDDPKQKALIQQKIKDLIDALDGDLAALMSSKIGGAIEFLARELGPNGVSASGIIKLGEDLKTQAAGPVHDAKEKLDASVRSTVDAATAAIDAAANLVTEQKEIFERVDDVYENQIKRLDVISREASDMERGGLRGVYTDAELSIFDDRKKGYQADAIKAKIDQTPALLASLDNLIAAQSAKAGKAGFLANNQGTSDNKIASAKADKDLLATMRERADVVAQLNLLQEEYNALTGVATEKNIALTDQIRYVLQGYSEQMAIQSQVGYNIKANIVDSLNSAKESFGTFLSDVLSGNKSISASFKEMAINVLKTMLDIQTQKLAAGLLGQAAGWAGSLLGSIFGPSGASTGTLSGGTIGQTFGDGITHFKTGGFVRMAGGGMNNRDSVQALLQPGEFVMRKQAVDMIGRNNLDAINAAGATGMSKSTPNPANSNGGGGDINVWVVTPDQKPSGLGKRDVIAVVGEDLMTGGTLKKLVTSISRGGG